MSVTLKTIAQYTGMSVTTVSRALKNGTDVKKPTRDLIQAAAKELGYAPNLQGLSLRTGINYTVAIILPLCRENEIDKNLGNLNLLSGIMSEFKDTPYSATILPMNPDDDPLHVIKYAVESGIAGGLIFSDIKLRDRRVAFLNEQEFPFVTFGQTEMGIQHPYVDFDQYDIGYRGGSYLFKNGCKNIRIFGPSLEYTSTSHRYYGVRRAAMEYGADFTEKNLLPNTDIHQNRRQEVADLINTEKPDGIFNASDLGALLSASAISDAGKKVFKDVKIITTETSYLPSLFSEQISALRTNYYQVGRKIAEFMIKRMETKTPVKELQLSMKARFVDRDNGLSREE